MEDFNNNRILSHDVSGDDIFFIRVPSKVPSETTETILEVSDPIYLDHDTFISVSLVCTMVICLFLLITRR